MCIRTDLFSFLKDLARDAAWPFQYSFGWVPEVGRRWMRDTLYSKAGGRVSPRRFLFFQETVRSQRRAQTEWPDMHASILCHLLTHWSLLI